MRPLAVPSSPFVLFDRYTPLPRPACRRTPPRAYFSFYPNCTAGADHESLAFPAVLLVISLARRAFAGGTQAPAASTRRSQGPAARPPPPRRPTRPVRMYAAGSGPLGGAILPLSADHCYVCFLFLWLASQKQWSWTKSTTQCCSRRCRRCSTRSKPCSCNRSRSRS